MIYWTVCGPHGIIEKGIILREEKVSLMRMKVSDYIAQKLVDEGITDAFMVTGGGAMHLDDGLGHQPGLHCYFNHHEQACAIAAEAYARIHNKIAALCVTTGPGGTNAITGVVGGWLDSIPMLVLSGQVRYDTTGDPCDGGSGIRDHKGDRLHDKVQRDGAGPDADPFLSGEIALSGADRKTGPVLARYSVECSGGLH